MTVVSQKDCDMVIQTMDQGDQDGQNQWLRKMLFPRLSDGVRQTGLPSGTFKQEWYDRNLNYEQMVCTSCYLSFSSVFS